MAMKKTLGLGPETLNVSVVRINGTVSAGI